MADPLSTLAIAARGNPREMHKAYLSDADTDIVRANGWMVAAENDLRVVNYHANMASLISHELADQSKKILQKAKTAVLLARCAVDDAKTARKGNLRGQFGSKVAESVEYHALVAKQSAELVSDCVCEIVQLVMVVISNA